MSVSGQNLLHMNQNCACRLCFGFHLNPSPRPTVQIPASRKWPMLDVSLEPECPHHGHKQSMQHIQRDEDTLGFALFSFTLYAQAKRLYHSYLKEITWMSTVRNTMVKGKKN